MGDGHNEGHVELCIFNWGSCFVQSLLSLSGMWKSQSQAPIHTPMPDLGIWPPTNLCRRRVGEVRSVSQVLVEARQHRKPDD